MKIAKSKNIEKLVIKANFMIQIWMCLFFSPTPGKPRGSKPSSPPSFYSTMCVVVSEGNNPYFLVSNLISSYQKRFQDTNDMGEGVEIIFAHCPIPVLPADVPI